MVKRSSRQLRILGLVKAMNSVRDFIAQHSQSGLTDTEVESLRAWVNGVLDQVEQICRQNKSSPEHLPAPSYRAYVYLKTLDLDALAQTGSAPSGSKVLAKPGLTANSRSTAGGSLHSRTNAMGNGSPPGLNQVRVANLIKTCNQLQTRMAEGSLKHARDEKGETTIAELLSRFRETAAQVEQICRKAGASPTELPAPSRRAYQWVTFLSDAGNLQAHMKALKLAIATASPDSRSQANCRKKMPPANRNLPMQFEFYNLPALYRARTDRKAIHIVASEGFIHAPAAVIEDLVCMTLLRKRNPYQARVQAYADTEDFAEVLLALELVGEGSKETLRGQHYDLEAVFQRVNEQYFQGRLERPRLTWNETITHRKFGHYQPATDTVMISISLDHPEVPSYLIEFVMYHELLHKQLGIKTTNGRHYAHHKTFREAESRFHRFAEVQEKLNELGRKVSL